MAIFRVEKNTNYTTMCNYHLRDRNLSLKAKGLLSLFLSLPDEWHYSVRGIASICKEGVDSVNGGLRELEDYGYLVRMQTRKENGQMGEIEYVIREMPLRQEAWESPQKGESRRGVKDAHGDYKDFQGGAGGRIGVKGDPCTTRPSGRRDNGKGMRQQIADIPQPERFGARNLQDGSPEPEIPDPFYQEAGDPQTGYQELENPQDGQSNSVGQWTGELNAGNCCPGQSDEGGRYPGQSNEGSRHPGQSDSRQMETGNPYEGNLSSWTSQAGRLALTVPDPDLTGPENPESRNPNPGSPRSAEPCTENSRSADPHTENPQPEEPCTENPYTATPNTEDPARINKEKRNKELNNKRERGRHAPERRRYGRYGNVLLSEKEVEELMTEFPWDYQQRIERLSEYMESTGRFYKNHLATIRSWAGQDRKKDRQKPYGPEIYQYSPEESL